MPVFHAFTTYVGSFSFIMFMFMFKCLYHIDGYMAFMLVLFLHLYALMLLMLIFDCIVLSSYMLTF